MRFVKNEAGWKELTQSPTGIIGQYLEKQARIIVALAKAQVGKKTGKLQKSINHNLFVNAGSLTVNITANNKIAVIHHEGTKPHVIMPKHAKTMRFSSNGKIVYAKIVHHPGTKPNKYLTDNLRKVIESD